MSDERIKHLIEVVDQQKGEMLFLQTLTNSIMKSMPPEFQIEVYQRFLKDAEALRSKALFSQTSDTVLSTFEHYCDALAPRKQKNS